MSNIEISKNKLVPDQRANSLNVTDVSVFRDSTDLSGVIKTFTLYILQI
jgi:hypothetical protein